MKKLIVGNWKMNGTLDDAKRLIADILNTIYGMPETLERCDIAVCPPFIHIPAIRHAITTVDTVEFGAQDCSAYEEGAFTGDVSAKMLKDSLCRYVILGHSERRAHQRETDDIIRLKTQRAHQAGLVSIVCVGESLSDREAGEEQAVVSAQLISSLPDSITPENTVVAYEPVWAIGTGKNAKPDDIADMHAFIRYTLGKQYGEEGRRIRILYGGSINPGNAAAILSATDVDGGLIGGASLKADTFIEIARAA